LNYGVNESPVKVGFETVEKRIPENMGIAVGILSLAGTEPEKGLGVIYPPPPQLQRTSVKIPLQHVG